MNGCGPLCALGRVAWGICLPPPRCSQTRGGGGGISGGLLPSTHPSAWKAGSGKLTLPVRP